MESRRDISVFDVSIDVAATDQTNTPDSAADISTAARYVYAVAFLENFAILFHEHFWRFARPVTISIAAHIFTLSLTKTTTFDMRLQPGICHLNRAEAVNADAIAGRRQHHRHR